MLQRAEDVFNGASPDGHCVRLPVESTLHGFEYLFVLPSSDAAIVAGRTSLLEMATRACAGPVHVQIHAILNGLESKNCALASGASILIVPGNVDEVAFGKEPFLPRRRGEWFRDIRGDPGQFTHADVRTTEVAAVSQHLQL